MRINKQWLIIAIVLFSLMLMGNYKTTMAESPGGAYQSKPEAPNSEDARIGYIEGISFEKDRGKERISISVSKQPVLKIENQSNNSILIKLENMLLRENLLQPLGEGQMDNVTRVIPYQDSEAGKQLAIIKTEIKQRVPYSVNREGQIIHLDFNLANISPAKEVSSAAPRKSPQKEIMIATNSNNDQGSDAKLNLSHNISVDFQDANIKSVLRLFAETGGMSIVSGDDVKGTVTVSMKRIPWDQAFDTILQINGLIQKQEGNVITVMTLDRFKKDEANRKSGEEERRKTEEDRRKAEQAILIEQGQLRQVNIEAKIVEASEDFLRQLGVQWGAGVMSNVGAYPYGVLGGTNPATTTGGLSTTLPNGIGLTNSNLAVNFPLFATAPTVGVIIGGANAVLSAQISALETNNQGQIISSPKVTTMDNVKATIKQGEEIPYTTFDDKGNALVNFKEALLKLEVTPKITAENKISMTIKATNDRGNYARAADLKGNVPIIKNEVDSTVVVQDGETIVIGGVLRTEDTTGTVGIPWLSNIPVLGWLFKTETVTKTKRHLLIFVTPKIVESDRPVNKARG
jgi:type IV pilus assembly protein PilQ